ncbi:hypothetical protein [Marinomonas sp.]
MMIVDLVDETDLKEGLIGIGVPIQLDDSLEQVKEAVVAWQAHSQAHAIELKKICTELNSPTVTLLPEVTELVMAFMSL